MVPSSPAGKRRASSVVEVTSKKAKVDKKVEKKVDKGVLELMEYSDEQEEEALGGGAVGVGGRHP